jgi:DNA adenine methylase
LRYMGSKRLIAKHILPIILQNRKPGQWYVEPFVGGANSIIHVDGNRIGSDANTYLIALLKALQSGWIPPETVSFEMYQDLKNYKYEYPDHLVGYGGFRCSYSGKWFSGFANNAKGTSRDYTKEGYADALKTAKEIQGINLQCLEYDKLVIPENSIIYCDPPYEGTAGYKIAFDHAKFWQWCRDKEIEGHEVYISEYNAPEDFVCLWEKQINCTLSKEGNNTKPIEKLFKWIL